MEAYEQVKKDEAEKRAALSSVSKECEKLKEAQQKLKCAEVELSAKIETLDKQIKDAEKKAKHWTKEVDQLRRVEKQEEIDYDFSDDEDEDEDDKMQEDEAKQSDVEEDDAMEENNDAEENGDESEPKDDDEPVTAKKVGSSSLPKLADASLEQYSTESIKNDVSVLEKERDTLAKNANMGAIAEYRKKEADYLSR